MKMWGCLFSLLIVVFLYGCGSNTSNVSPMVSSTINPQEATVKINITSFLLSKSLLDSYSFYFTIWNLGSTATPTLYYYIDYSVDQHPASNCPYDCVKGNISPIISGQTITVQPTVFFSVRSGSAWVADLAIYALPLNYYPTSSAIAYKGLDTTFP
jgi:hypothetical protein